MLLAVKMTGSRRGRRSPPLQRFAGENGMDGAHGAKHVGGMNAFTWWHDAISRRGTQAAQRFLPVASSRMKTRILSWLVLGCLAGAGAWAAPLPGRTPHIDDTVHLLPPIPGDQDALEAKLINGLGEIEDAYAKAKELAKAPNAAIVSYEAQFSLSRIFQYLGSEESRSKVEIDLTQKLLPALEPGRAYWLPGFYGL